MNKNNPIVTELIPTNGRKSFYGRAKIVSKSGRKYLVSYNTLMCGVDGEGNVRRYSKFRSHTTNCHVKSFLATFGSNVSSAEFNALPVESAPDIGIVFE